jgi:hypothetical protein
MESNKEIFSSIYQNHGFGSTESRSGPGSTLSETEKLRESIRSLIKDYNIKSITDLPCGDLNWIHLLFNDVEKYTGCDIVEECVQDNKNKYPEHEFHCLDLALDKIPESDLLIVRDVIGHQPLETGLNIVKNILNSKCKYLLSTTWANKTGNSWKPSGFGEVDRENEGVEFGRFYPVNLMSEPFNFPDPELYIEEDVVVDNHSSGNRKTLCLWSLEEVKEHFNKNDKSMIAKQSNAELELPKSKSNNLTIVSGLWDINRVGRDWSRYEEHFDKFLKIPCNMVLWVPRSLESFVWERRSKENTFVRIYELEDIKNGMFSPFWDKWQSIRNNPTWQNQAGWLPESPQCKNEYYNPIVMSKMFFLHDSKIWNPFNTDYFVWLDAGISQTVYENYFYDEKILDGIVNAIDPFLFLSYPYEADKEIHGFDSNSINRYAGTKVDYVCRGGLFGGHKDFLSEANAEYYSLLERSINEGLAGTEESVFAIMAKLSPENYKRYSLDSNGLVVKFLQAIESDSMSLEKHTSLKPKFMPVVLDISKVKTNLYFLTFNFPDQLEATIKSLEKHEDFLTHPCQKVIIDNSTNQEAREGNKAICEAYGFEHIVMNKNTGICGGRQFAAEHFDAGDSDFYLFFEDDMTISDPEEGVCRNGFQKYIPNLYKKIHQIMLKEKFDFLKLSYTEVYMDNNIQVSWYNVPQSVRDEVWPNYSQLPTTGFDANCPRTKLKSIEVHDGLSYLSGEIYYANWPHITSRQGNKKMFIDTKWAHPYEQTWMSHIFQESRKGNINPAVLLASAVTHDRFKHYKPEERIEG